MKSKRLLDIVGDIDDKYIAEAAPAAKKPRKNPAWVKWAAAAACLVLLVSVGLGSFAVAAEAKEYKAAIQFFNEYGMSTEGLTRGEIKAVWRDITTKSFTYSKTAEVIKNSTFADKVGGFDIEQSEPTPDDIENLENNKTNTPDDSKKGIHYEKYYENGIDGIEKYDGEELIWRVTMPNDNMDYPWFNVVSDGVIVYGSSDPWSSERYGWLAKIDQDGNIVWKQKRDHGDEHIYSVLENDDGSYAVFSRGGRGTWDYFCFSKYTSDGKETLFRKTNVGQHYIGSAARFGDGYIVKTSTHNDCAKIIKVDREGNVTDSFLYDDENANYRIMDMIEFNGKIYLSAYAVPKPTDGSDWRMGRSELGQILDYLFDHRIQEISSEELTPMVRDRYTAVLLVCEPDSGRPQEFYSVKGSLGSKLSVSDTGELIWDVNSITSTFFSPATSSFTIRGDCYVFRYTFDKDGTLISQEKTEEVVGFRR